MRTIPVESQLEMNKHCGTEPVFILDIAWSLDDNIKTSYSDQKINGLDYPHPAIVTLSSLDATIKIASGPSSSDSQSISVVLDDFDGSLKSIIDSQDIHMRPCWLYQSFQGLALDKKFLVFKGHIVTPIVWDEGERTLSFCISTQQTDVELAFSMEEGDFPNIPADALGKVWPLVFGTVCNMQAINVRTPRKGYLTTGEGVHDFTLEPRICQARFIQCPSVPIGIVDKVYPVDELTEEHKYHLRMIGFTDADFDNAKQHFLATQEQQWGPDTTCVNNRFEKLCELESLLAQEKTYEHLTFTVRGGNKFPQNTLVSLNINSAIFTGVFSGETFTVHTRLHPDAEGINPQTGNTYKSELICADVGDRGYVPKFTQTTYGWTRNDVDTAWKYDPNVIEDCNGPGELNLTAQGGPTDSQKAYDAMPTGSFCWLPGGSEVFLVSEAELLYIVSLIPGTVNNVAAYYKQSSGRELLMSVPTTYYTVYETDYVGYQVVELGFSQPINQIDSNWGDTIYVSFTSDVGPNPCDVIEWLVNKYTDFQIDNTSFNYVKTKLANYPVNFYINSKQTVLKTVQDIAYQTRCAIFIRDNIIFINYLLEEPTSLRTITASDIIANTLQIQYAETDDLVTKYVTNWKKSDAGVASTDDVNQVIILKHNIKKYGTISYEHDYYTQNTYETILKSASFWLIRLANCWKTIKFDMPLTMLDLDVFDCITIDNSKLAPTPTKVIITSALYDNTSNTIHFECLTPLLSGSTTPYQFFWPANIDPNIIFPAPDDVVNAGAGVSFQITPPVGHILRGGDTNQPDSTRIIATSGDNHPSDLDDSYPSLPCDESNFFGTTNKLDIMEEDPVITAAKRAAAADLKAIDTVMNQKAAQDGGGGGGGKPPKNDQKKKKDKPKESEGCGKGVKDAGCLYEVSVTYVNPGNVAHHKLPTGGCGGPCGCFRQYIDYQKGIIVVTGEPLYGDPCISKLTTVCHTFGSVDAAAAFVYAMKAKIDALRCNYRCNKTEPFQVSGIRALADPNAKNNGSVCDEIPLKIPSPPDKNEKPIPEIVENPYFDDPSLSPTPVNPTVAPDGTNTEAFYGVV